MREDRPSERQLEAVWQRPAGIRGWFSVVNNQPLGKRFMLTAFIFFTIGGILALLMRIQLAVADNTFLGPEVYNQLFTMHGSTMMYLFSVPFLEGLALFLIPLMIGSRDVAFPRLTSFGFWTYLAGGTIFYASFLFGTVPNAGWFAYTPLSGPDYSDVAIDFWLMGLSLVEISGLAAGVEIVVTILRLRAPGMSLNRMPIFSWAMLVAGLMIIFAFTVLLTATIMLELDRTLGTAFFDPGRGGSSLLWQHLFWFFGHPEVYIMFIPATGIISMVIPAFARRPLSGYLLVAVAIVVTGFISFGLWVHHMFATGIPALALSFFTAASLMIGLASGTQIFAWIATMWRRRPAMKVAMLYALGFIFLFVLGGITGIMIAVVPFDLQVHDTFFIVAHFHYVLIGGVVFPVFSGLYYWLPKITGRLLNEPMGKWNFWLTFIGFNITFFPMHQMGFFGMPRRVYTYPEVLGLEGYNLAATIGAFIFAAGFLVFLINFFWSLRKGEAYQSDPWKGESLEWSVESPPRVFSFFRPPVVNSRHPMWEKTEEHPADERLTRAADALAGGPVEFRATLSTDVLHAEPQAVQVLPGPSLYPVLVTAGLVLACIGIISQFYLVTVFGFLLSAVMIVQWLQPDPSVLKKLREIHRERKYGLPIFTTGTRAVGWWGAVSLITIIGVSFGALFFSYFYLRLYSPMWPQGGIPQPEMLLPLGATAMLLMSAFLMLLAVKNFRTGDLPRVKLMLSAAFALGIAFAVMQVVEFLAVGFGPQANAYASIFFAISWLLSLCVLTGLALNLGLIVRVWKEYDEDRDGLLPLQVQITSLFWYFVAAAGVLVFAVLYGAPYII